MTIKFDEQTGLVPAIIQDAQTKNVLMLGYMNQESFDKTIDSNMVTFYLGFTPDVITRFSGLVAEINVLTYINPTR